MNNTHQTFRQFFHVFLPIFMGFIFYRLMIQIDLLMLAPFGTTYIAAFSVPAKIMLLDLLAAFSIGPVASIYLSQAKNKHEQSRLAGQIIIISSLISLVVTAIGFIIYPQVLKILISDQNIFKVASVILLWATISIPFRLLNFISSMMLHGISKGRIVIIVDFIALVLNIPLNYFLIKLIGVYGIFISTCILTCLTSFAFVFILTKILTIKWRDHIYIKIKVMNDFFLHGRQEFFRLCLFFGHGLVVIIILGRLAGQSSLAVMAAFSASSELAQAILMFYMAIMRSVAIIYSKDTRLGLENLNLRNFHVLKIVVFSLIIGLILVVINTEIGVNLYRLDNLSLEWWSSYIVYFALALPLIAINSFIRGILQAQKQFKKMFLVEFLSRWILGMPILILGILNNMPQVAWLYLLLSEIFEMVCYVVHIRSWRHSDLALT